MEKQFNVFLCVNFSQEAGAVDEIIQPDIRLSSRPENSPQVTTLQTSPAALTPTLDPVSHTSPLKSHPAPEDFDTSGLVKTQTHTDSQMVDGNQSGDTKPQPLTGNGQLSKLDLGNLEMPWRLGGSVETRTPVHTLQTVQYPKQYHQPLPAAKKSSRESVASGLDSDETAILSPNLQSENPTATAITSGRGGADTETLSTERSISNGPRGNEFATRSTLISAPITEAWFVPMREGTKKVGQEASPLVIQPSVSAESQVKLSRETGEDITPSRTGIEDIKAPQTHPPPNLTILTPTLQSREALKTERMESDMSNVSASAMKEKEEMDKSLEAVSVETETSLQQPPSRGHQGNGTGTETDEIDSRVEDDEYSHTAIEEESYDNDTGNFKDTNQSSPDWISHLSTEDSSIQSKIKSRQQTVKAANHPPAYTVNPQRTKMRPGIRGQRVRHCFHKAVPKLMLIYSHQSKMSELKLLKL